MQEQSSSLAEMMNVWCRDAVAKWGDDWSRINEHIQSCYRALDGHQRAQLEKEAAFTLAGADRLFDDAVH